MVRRDGGYGIVQSFVFENGSSFERSFGSFDSLEIAERLITSRLDLIGVFEDYRLMGNPLASAELYICDADGKRVEQARSAFWDAALDSRLFEVLCEVSRSGEALESTVVFSGNSYSQAVSAFDTFDLERVFDQQGGYGYGVVASVAIIDSSPCVTGGSAVRDLSRRFDDSVYERKLTAIGQAVHDGVLERADIRELYEASDSEIDFAEAVYERPSGQLSTMLAEAPVEDAPVKRNADARELSMTQGSNAKRDKTIRR